MSIRYSAPAKVILSGEHSVTYLRPAFVTSVGYRITATIRDPSDDHITPKTSMAGKAREGIQACEDAVIHYLSQKKIPFKKKPYVIHYASDIPIGRGMGSSAAFSVATAAALVHWLTGKTAEKEAVGHIAHQAEKYFHGSPSGVDVSASCYGGLIYYRKEFEFLRTISALNFKLPRAIADNLILIDSGKPVESTADMIRIVGKRYNEHPRGMEEVLSRLEKMTRRMVIAVANEQVGQFAEILAEHHRLLHSLGIVSSKTQKLIQSLLPYGVGKVTGAGGHQKNSGMILFFADDPQEMMRYLDTQNISYLRFIQDHEGLHREENEYTESK